MGFLTAVLTARVIALTSAAVVGQGPGPGGSTAGAGALIAIVLTAAGVVLISIIIKKIIISL